MATTPVTVAVLTYRRPEELARVLPPLLAEADRCEPPARVLVVDNDAGGSGAPVVRAVAGDRGRPRVDYVVEPAPGIAAARNRALDEAGGEGVLVFLDDDELPTDGWLQHLLDTAAHTGAAAVAGPVVSTFEPRPDPWIEAGGFFAREHRRGLVTGDVVAVAATNNLLLRLDVLARTGLRFDAALGLRGGEDTRFTRALTAAGERVVWCREAVVTEPVPAARTTRRYLLARTLNSGNIEASADVEAARGPRSLAVRATWLARGAVRAVGGAARWLLGVLTGSVSHRARGVRTATRGVGMLVGAAGVAHRAYRRAGDGA